MLKKYYFITLSSVFIFGCVAVTPQFLVAKNLFDQENKWEACDYYDPEQNKVIKEDCKTSKIKISSCSDGTCFFQADFNNGDPWVSECIMWGKLTIKDTNHATGNAIAEYRKKGLNDRKFEDCELDFNIIDKTMKISIKSGCLKWCKSSEFEFDNIYHINNTGGSVTP